MNPRSTDLEHGRRSRPRPSAPRRGGRRPYAPPRLEALGDLRTLTLGGSPGLGDSGDPLNFEPPQT